MQTYHFRADDESPDIGSEVIRDGLRALLARDRAMEDWLRDEVVPAAAALKGEPERALSTEQVREHMAARRQRKNPGKP